MRPVTLYNLHQVKDPTVQAALREVDRASQESALFTATFGGIVPQSGGGTVNFLRADGTWAAPPSQTQGTTQTITGVSYTILPTDGEIYVNHNGPVTLTLPSAAAWAASPGAQVGFALLIKDISGAAGNGTNTITINRAGADTIDGLTSLLINTNYGGFKLRAPLNWAIVG